MNLLPYVLRQKFLYFDCYSGLDPESRISELDSRFRGNDGFGTNVKKRWTHNSSKSQTSLQTPILCTVTFLQAPEELSQGSAGKGFLFLDRWDEPAL